MQKPNRTMLKKIIKYKIKTESLIKNICHGKKAFLLFLLQAAACILMV